MKLLVTGGAGFVGSNFVHHMLAAHPDYKIVVVDALTYAGNLENLEPALRNPNLEFVRADICDPLMHELAQGCDMVAHLAAETHVDRSIDSSAVFVRTNVQGTHSVLEACRAARVPRLLHVSTDEVYGSLGPTGRFTETSPLHPNSPYAATKAASDLLVMAFVHTFKVPAIITRCSNNHGPYQFPEKFLPLMIAQALAGKPLPVYGDGLHVRDWLRVDDHCRALDLALHKGRDGEVYNIGGDAELLNLEVARRVLRALGQDEKLIEFVEDRPGHDRRYALDSSKIERELGWKRQWEFEAGLAATIQWYRENQAWLDRARDGAYREYFDKHYRRRAATQSAVPVP
jgi:dTDP-glucose 4,6-dehydratase